MKEILNDLDKLNAFHPYCSLDKWIEDARKMGDSPQLKDYYEKNARNLITTWGGEPERLCQSFVGGTDK